MESGAKGSINNTQPLTIGFSRAGAVNRYFNGSMDEVRIYNRALTAEDVLKLYNNGGPTTIRNATISNVVIE